MDQFVLEDGRTYRPSAIHEGVHKACKSLADVVSLEDNDLGDPESFAQRCFGKSHAASIITMKKNGWRPTPASILDDVQKACVEHGHGGL